MTEVYTVTLSIIGFLVTYPGLAAALNLLLPGPTGKAYERLAYTPVKSFVVGLFVGGLFLLPAGVLIGAGPGPVKAIGFLIGLVGGGLATIGAAGMARLLGERIAGLNQGDMPTLGQIVRGAVVYELACLVPAIGWFLFLPIVWFMLMGAAAFGLVGWGAKPRSAAPPPALGIKQAAYEGT